VRSSLLELDLRGDPEPIGDVGLDEGEEPVLGEAAVLVLDVEGLQVDLATEVGPAALAG
jgi:hypothetical protein